MNLCFLYFIFNKKTSPVFRWTGRPVSQNDSKESNSCTTEDYDPAFCDSRGYVRSTT